MKLSEIIEDTGINKGIIVSKNGFTPDGIEFAKYRNIGLVELREFEEKDFQNNPRQIEFGTLELSIKTSIKRPEMLSIEIGDNRKIEVKHELDYYNFIIILMDGNQVPLYNYVTDFRNEINAKNNSGEIINKLYQVSGSTLFNRQTKVSLKIDEITFTGQLIEIDASKNLKYNLVDKVWLIMKSIFDKRTFTFSENGIILEHKKI